MLDCLSYFRFIAVKPLHENFCKRQRANTLLALKELCHRRRIRLSNRINEQVFRRLIFLNEIAEYNVLTQLTHPFQALLQLRYLQVLEARWDLHRLCLPGLAQEFLLRSQDLF